MRKDCYHKRRFNMEFDMKYNRLVPHKKSSNVLSIYNETRHPNLSVSYATDGIKQR